MHGHFEDDQDFHMNLGIDQFLHRGSYVENSDYIYAMVIYTGVESKLILNMGKYVYKMSSYEKILNKIMVINLLMAIGIALITAGVYVWWVDENTDLDYLF